MRLDKGPQCNDAGEARTRSLSVSSQALYHWATALPFQDKGFLECVWIYMQQTYKYVNNIFMTKYQQVI